MTNPCFLELPYVISNAQNPPEVAGSFYLNVAGVYKVVNVQLPRDAQGQQISGNSRLARLYYNIPSDTATYPANTFTVLLKFLYHINESDFDLLLQTIKKVQQTPNGIETFRPVNSTSTDTSTLAYLNYLDPTFITPLSDGDVNYDPVGGVDFGSVNYSQLCTQWFTVQSFFQPT